MKWSDEKLNTLIELYPTQTNLEISKILNISKNSVNSKARRLELYKPEDFLIKINKLRTRDLSYENLSLIAKEYKTKMEFSENDPSAYFAARKMKILGEICSHMLPQCISIPELMLKYIISELFDVKILHNNKKIIFPYELDIYIPKFKLAFEYDGAYWHNIETDNIKDDLCIKNNIILIRIDDNKAYYYIDNIKNQLKSNINKINNYCKKNITIEQIDNISENKIYSFVNDNILDYNNIKEITNKYDNYKDFKVNEKKLFRKLCRLKIVNEYTKHMYKDVIYWDIKMCEEEISKYKNFIEFKEKSLKCYYYIQKHKLYYLLEKFNYVKFKKKLLQNL